MTGQDAIANDRSAVDKAFSVLKAFGRDAQMGIGVSELSRRAHLSKSTTFRVLGMLERNGVVERAGTAYRIGRILSEIGAPPPNAEHDLARDLLTPYLADLYGATRMTVQLAALSGAHVTYLNKLEGHHRLRSPSRIGGRMPAYCTAVGKMLLAFDQAATEATLRSPRHAWTETTITDEHELQAELWRIRQTGISIDRGESLASLACIAAPIMGRGNRPIAAFSISGDASTFVPQRVEGVLRQTCLAASRAIRPVTAVA